MNVGSDVILLPDDHKDERLAERHDNFIRQSKPDAVVHEFPWDDKLFKGLANYRTFERIYDELDVPWFRRIEVGEDLLQQPNFELEKEEVESLLEPVNSYSIDNEQLNEALNHIKDNNSSTHHDLGRRSACIFGERLEDGDPMYFVYGDDRRKVAEYAVNLSWFPHDDVDQIEDNLVNGGIPEDFSQHYRGLYQSIEVTRMRDSEMADTIVESLQKPDVDYTLGIFGIAHIEGVSENLNARGYDVNIVDMRGDSDHVVDTYRPEEWDYELPKFSIKSVPDAL